MKKTIHCTLDLEVWEKAHLEMNLSARINALLRVAYGMVEKSMAIKEPKKEIYGHKSQRKNKSMAIKSNEKIANSYADSDQLEADNKPISDMEIDNILGLETAP